MTTDTVALEQEVHELLSRLGVPESCVFQGELDCADADHRAKSLRA